MMNILSYRDSLTLALVAFTIKWVISTCLESGTTQKTEIWGGYGRRLAFLSCRTRVSCQIGFFE